MDLLPHASLIRGTLCLIKEVGIYPQTLLRRLSLSGASNTFSSHRKILQNGLNVEKWKWKEANKDILGVDYWNSILKIFILGNSLPDCNNICRICFLILSLQKEYWLNILWGCANCLFLSGGFCLQFRAPTISRWRLVLHTSTETCLPTRLSTRYSFCLQVKLMWKSAQEEQVKILLQDGKCCSLHS